MLSFGKNTSWKKWVTWLVVASVLVGATVSNLTLHRPARSALDNRTFVSISSYLQDYALLTYPARGDTKTYKLKGAGSNSAGLAPTENKKEIDASLYRQSYSLQNPARLLIYFAETDTTSQNWLHYACNLLDLPPPLVISL